MQDKYQEFIDQKRPKVPVCGFEPLPIVAPLFPFQAHSVRWAVRLGRAALFLNTGLGKTRCQLEWARQVAEHTGGKVLILAPLAVSQQTCREGAAVGIECTYVRDASEVGDKRIVITNYERLGKFDGDAFVGIVLDESSILKSYSGTMKTAIFAKFARTGYKLACTATPAPNDHLELGNHAEFLQVMTSHEMIARWFINDTSEFGTYRLKKHSINMFWDWVSSWAVMGSLPSDVGDFDDNGYVLPELFTHEHIVTVDLAPAKLVGKGQGTLIRMVDMNATGIHDEKRRTANERAKKLAEIVAAEPEEQWLLWCETDYESDAIQEAIPEAVDVRGSDSLEKKEASLMAFAAGDIRIMITKPKLAGFGMNFQNCARVGFISATYSFESHYQAIRRSWRFGQKRAVHCHVTMASTELALWRVFNQKRQEFEAMQTHMFTASRRSRKGCGQDETYTPDVPMMLPVWMKGRKDAS